MFICILALPRVDVSIAYPMLSMSYVVNALAAWQLFDKCINPAGMIGIGVVLLEVYVLPRS